MAVTQDTRVAGCGRRFCQLILVLGNNPRLLRIVNQVDQAVGVVSNIKDLPLGPLVDGEVEERATYGSALLPEFMVQK